jgi:hypothetical protein
MVHHAEPAKVAAAIREVSRTCGVGCTTTDGLQRRWLEIGENLAA